MSLDKMTPEEEIINKAFEAFQEYHKISFDDFLDIMAKQMLINESNEPHEIVKSCFRGCAVHLRNASFAFYASTK